MSKQFTKQFSRRKLYEEIWTYALSNVAKKYDVPYSQLRVACSGKSRSPHKATGENFTLGKMSLGSLCLMQKMT